MTIHLHDLDNLQFVLQLNLPYRACRGGWIVKPNQKGHVLQWPPFHSAYIEGWCVKRFVKHAVQELAWIHPAGKKAKNHKG